MIRILTDSSSGLTVSDAKKINAEIAHMPVTFEDEDYLDGLNLSNEQFYEKLNKHNNLPKTSLVSQYVFEEIFNDVKNKGDEMIVLVISTELSKTTEQAIKAKQSVNYNKIYIVNTLNTINGLIALVAEAARLRDQNISGFEIASKLQNLVPKIKLFGYVDTLKYLRAGGRISGAAAVIGSALNVKPIISIDSSGKLVNIGKCIGTKKAQAFILSKLSEHNFNKNYPVYFSHANAQKECEDVKQLAKKMYDVIDGGTYGISATVGTHTGPGAISVVFFET